MTSPINISSNSWVPQRESIMAFLKRRENESYFCQFRSVISAIFFYFCEFCDFSEFCDFGEFCNFSEFCDLGELNDFFEFCDFGEFGNFVISVNLVFL